MKTNLQQQVSVMIEQVELCDDEYNPEFSHSFCTRMRECFVPQLKT